MFVCVCVCVSVVGVSSASFNMVFISNEFLIRKMVFDACYNHRPTRRRRPGSEDFTHTNGKQNNEGRRYDVSGTHAPPPSTSQLGASPPMASIAGLATAPGTATWTRNSADSSSSFMVSCEDKNKKKSVGDECVSRHVIGWGRVDEIESVKTMSLSLSLSLSAVAACSSRAGQ